MQTKNLKLSGLFTLMFLLFITTACSEDSLSDPNMEPMEEEMEEEDDNTIANAEIWTGTNLTFSKANNANPNEESNQDRLTDNVWITRGNNGGQIYNAKTESSANKSNSPAGTEWAIGDIADIATLTFRPFREAVSSPKSVAGKDLVLHLTDDNIYLKVRFSSWSSSKGGGFTYVRSTK